MLNKSLFCIVLCSLLSCAKDKNISIRNNSDLKGTWTQPRESGYFEALYHDFVFKCDSFELVLTNVSDVRHLEDTCQNLPYHEYVIGRYELVDGILSLSGIYTDSLHRPITSGCYHMGAYQKEHHFITDKTSIILNPSESDIVKKVKLQKTSEFDCSQ
jgi:hypothetical protein